MHAAILDADAELIAMEIELATVQAMRSKFPKNARSAILMLARLTYEDKSFRPVSTEGAQIIKLAELLAIFRRSFGIVRPLLYSLARSISKKAASHAVSRENRDLVSLLSPRESRDHAL